MTKLSFDRAAYTAQLTAFRSATVTADGKGDNVTASGMAALLLGELSPLALAITFYDCFQPKDAKGKGCEPKEADDGTIRVRNLEQPGLKGSGGARVALEALLYCYAHRSDAAAAVEAFAMGEGFKRGERTVKGLSNLKALIKANRSAAARDAAGDRPADNDDAADDAAIVASMSDGERLAVVLAELRKVEAAGDASERLILTAIAAEIDRISAAVPASEELAAAA